MPKILSEQQKRAKRQSAVIARNRQSFEKAEATPEEARRLAVDAQAIREWNSVRRDLRQRLMAEALGQASPILITLVQKAITAK